MEFGYFEVAFYARYVVTLVMLCDLVLSTLFPRFFLWEILLIPFLLIAKSPYVSLSALIGNHSVLQKTLHTPISPNLCISPAASISWHFLILPKSPEITKWWQLIELYGFSPEKHDPFFLRHRICWIMGMVRKAVLSNDFVGSLAWFWWVHDAIQCSLHFFWLVSGLELMHVRMTVGFGQFPTISLRMLNAHVYPKNYVWNIFFLWRKGSVRFIRCKKIPNNRSGARFLVWWATVVCS